MRVAGHLVLVLVLTVLSQVGGLAWLIGLWVRRPWVAVPAYIALSLLVHLAAPLAGREALPCFGTPLRVENPLICALNRNYADARLVAAAHGLASQVDSEFPGTVTQVKEAELPLGLTMRLMSGLGPEVGAFLDVAVYPEDGQGVSARAEAQSCLGHWLTLAWLWPDSPDVRPDRANSVAALVWLAAQPELGEPLVVLHDPAQQPEPTAGLPSCPTTRHDDHIHIRL